MGYSKVVFGSTPIIDLTNDSVTAPDILEGKTAHGADGEIITGSMPNRGGTSGIIGLKSEVIPISRGYHDGSGSVKISDSEQDKIISGNIKQGVEILGVTGNFGRSQSKTVTPSESVQEILPDEGYEFLARVTVNATEQREDFSGDTAQAKDLLSGKTAHGATGAFIGTMTNRGKVTKSLTSVDEKYTIPEGYHNGSGSVAISTANQNKLIAANIKSGVTILGVTGSFGQAQSKRVTPSDSEQSITPDEGYDFLSGVIVEAVEQTQTVDLSGDTVTADKLLKGTTAHDSDGELITGTLEVPNLSGDTVTAKTLLKGVKAHDKNGNLITGELELNMADFVVENHVVTEYEAADKAFILKKAGTLISNVVVAMDGVIQRENVDYKVTTATGTISWGGLGLDTIGIEEDDVFTVIYKSED